MLTVNPPVTEVPASTPDVDSISALISSASVVSEREATENALRESNEKFHQLADNITDAFWIRSHDMREVHYVSPAFERIWGRSVESLYASPETWTDFIVPEDRDRVSAAFAGLMGDAPALDIEYRIVRPNGDIRWVRVRAFKVRDQAGQPIRHTGIVTDITERKQVDTALRESEERYRALADAMPQIVWVTQPNGSNVYVNRQWTDYTGRTAKESLGQEWNTSFHPDDQQRAMEAWKRATIAVETYVTECRLRRADGVYRWWLMRGVPQLDERGNVLQWFGTCTDIHELKLAQLEVSRANRALHMLSDCNDAVIRADLELDLLNEVCRIIVELGGYRMAWAGYARDDDARSITPIAHAGAEDGYLSEIAVTWNENDRLGQGPVGRVIRSGEAVVSEDVAADPTFAPWFTHALRRGYRGVICLPLRQGSHTFGLLGLYSADVRRMSAEEIALLQEMADRVAFGIAVRRTQLEQRRLQAAVVTVAAGVSGAEGLEFFEGLVRSLSEAVGAEAAFLARLVEGVPPTARTIAAVVDGKAIDNFEYGMLGTPCEQLLTVDTCVISKHVAERFPASPTLAALHAQGYVGRRLNSSSGEPLGMLFVLFRSPLQHVEFITSTLQIFAARAASELERQRADAQKKVLEAQFFRAQRMESIGTLAGGIAHDLNNVLAPIMMSVDMLKELARNDDDRALLDTLQSSAQRGADLVKQVLSFARGVEGQRVTVDPIHLMRDLFKVIRDTFPKSIRARFTPAPGLWTVTGDPTQMHQVFLNLCVNARDAMPDGGQLTVTMDNVVIDETYAAMHPDYRPGSYVVVTVQDDGAGISPETLDRVFEPFFTTKGFGEGTGLGLSTTLGIVKSHGGFIRLHSALGKGTRFKVFLPANTEQTAGDADAEDRRRLPSGNGELILVVDDEDAIRRVAQHTLERHGYRVLLAVNGADAVALYTEHRSEIAVVLTDMAMAVMDGAATIRALRALDPAVTIIASSGGGVDISHTAGAGAQYFVAKPYTADAILTALREALGTGC